VRRVDCNLKNRNVLMCYLGDEDVIEGKTNKCPDGISTGRTVGCGCERVARSKDD
jgi:hypothetical protein